MFGKKQEDEQKATELKLILNKSSLDLKSIIKVLFSVLSHFIHEEALLEQKRKDFEEMNKEQTKWKLKTT